MKEASNRKQAEFSGVQGTMNVEDMNPKASPDFPAFQEWCEKRGEYNRYVMQDEYGDDNMNITHFCELYDGKTEVAVQTRWDPQVKQRTEDASRGWEVTAAIRTEVPGDNGTEVVTQEAWGQGHKSNLEIKIDGDMIMAEKDGTPSGGWRYEEGSKWEVQE